MGARHTQPKGLRPDRGSSARSPSLVRVERVPGPPVQLSESRTGLAGFLTLQIGLVSCQTMRYSVLRDDAVLASNGRGHASGSVGACGTRGREPIEACEPLRQGGSADG